MRSKQEHAYQRKCKTFLSDREELNNIAWQSLATALACMCGEFYVGRVQGPLLACQGFCWRVSTFAGRGTGAPVAAASQVTTVTNHTASTTAARTDPWSHRQLEGFHAQLIAPGHQV